MLSVMAATGAASHILLYAKLYNDNKGFQKVKVQRVMFFGIRLKGEGISLPHGLHYCAWMEPYFLESQTIKTTILNDSV